MGSVKDFSVLCQSTKFIGIDFYDEMSQSFELCLSDALIPENSSLFKESHGASQNIDENYRTPWKKVKIDKEFLSEEAKKITDSIQALSLDLEIPEDRDLLLFKEHEIELNNLVDLKEKLGNQDSEAPFEVDLEALREDVLNDGLPLLDEPITPSDFDNILSTTTSFSLLKKELKLVEVEDPFELKENMDIAMKETLSSLFAEDAEEQTKKVILDQEKKTILKELELPEIFDESIDAFLDDGIVPDNSVSVTSKRNMDEDNWSLYSQFCCKESFENPCANITFQNCTDQDTDSLTFAAKTDAPEVADKEHTFTVNNDRVISRVEQNISKKIKQVDDMDSNGSSYNFTNNIDGHNELLQSSAAMCSSQISNNSSCSKIIEDNFSNLTKINDNLNGFNEENSCVLINKCDIESSNREESHNLHKSFLENLSKLNVNQVIKKSMPRAVCESFPISKRFSTVTVNKNTNSSFKNNSFGSENKLSQDMTSRRDKVNVMNTNVSFNVSHVFSEFLTVKSTPVNEPMDTNFSIENEIKSSNGNSFDLLEEEFNTGEFNYPTVDCSKALCNSSQVFTEYEEIPVTISGDYLNAILCIENMTVPLLSKLLTFNQFALPLESTLSSISSEETCYLLNKELRSCQDKGVDLITKGLNDSYYCILLKFHGLLKAIECVTHFDLGTAISCLKTFETCHISILKGCYEECIRQLSCISNRSNCIHPKIKELCSYLQKKYVSYQKNCIKFKVLLVVDRYRDTFFSSLSLILRKCADQISLYLIKETLDLQRDLILFSDDQSCIFVVSSSIFTEDLPWKEVTLVLEYECNEASNWRKMCLKNSIAFSSMAVFPPCSKKLSEMQLALIEIKNIPETDQLFQLLISESITSNFDLLFLLESQKNIICIERNYTNHLPHLYFADIVLNEKNGIVLVSLEKLNCDEYIENLTHQLFFLHVKYEVCWVIFSFPRPFDCLDTKGKENFHNLVSTINYITMKIDSYAVKLLYASDHEETSHWIKSIASNAAKSDSKNTKCTIAPMLSEMELFLVSFPCLNPFVVQLMLSSKKVHELFSMTVEGLSAEFPSVPLRILKSFHHMVHTPDNVEHIVEKVSPVKENDDELEHATKLSMDVISNRISTDNCQTTSKNIQKAEILDFSFEFEKNMSKKFSESKSPFNVSENIVDGNFKKIQDHDQKTITLSSSPFSEHISDSKEMGSYSPSKIDTDIPLTATFDSEESPLEDLLSDVLSSRGSKNEFSSPEITLEDIDRDYLSLQFGKTPYSKRFINNTLESIESAKTEHNQSFCEDMQLDHDDFRSLSNEQDESSYFTNDRIDGGIVTNKEMSLFSTRQNKVLPHSAISSQLSPRIESTPSRSYFTKSKNSSEGEVGKDYQNNSFYKPFRSQFSPKNADSECRIAYAYPTRSAQMDSSPKHATSDNRWDSDTEEPKVDHPQKSSKDLNLKQYCSQYFEKNKPLAYSTPVHSLRSQKNSYSKVLRSRKVSKRTGHDKRTPSQDSSTLSSFHRISVKRKPPYNDVGVVRPYPKAQKFEESQFISPSYDRNITLTPSQNRCLGFKKVPGAKGQTRLVFY